MALTIRKRGKYWHARGSVSMRQADGRIIRQRIETSTRETSKARAARVAQDLADYYHEQAYRPKPRSISFTEAAITYVESKNPSKRDRAFAAKLVGFFGDTPIAEIDQAAVATAAHTLYSGCSGSTHNRAVFAPVTTILRLSGVRTDLRRPKVDRRPKDIPPDTWFDALLPHCPPRLASLLVFLTLTGRRITEALEAIDNGDGTCIIGKTKTGSAVVCRIPDLCLDFLERDNRMDRGRILRNQSNRLFGYSDRHNVYRALRAACKRAGVQYYGTHALGRHAFATRLLKAGKSLKFVADAGGWASIKMPATHYAHLEHSEVQEDVRKVGEEWTRKRRL